MHILDLLALLQWPGLRWLENNETLTSSVRNLATALGIILGGAFAFYKFVFEGAYSPRLQPNVSAEVIVGTSSAHLRISVTAENIGKNKVKLDNGITGLSVSYLKQGNDGWSEPDTSLILEEQGQIRPGAVSGDQIWVEILDADLVAIQLEFYVGAKKLLRGSPIWMHREIVSLVDA